MNDELNFLDRFLYKFIICLVLLISVLLLNKVNVVDLNKVQSKMSENINILKVLKLVNGEKGVFIPIELNDDVLQTVSQTYLNYKEIDGGKRIFINEMQGVEVYKTGIIIKIFQNKDDTFRVTVKGIDDIEYVYDNLETLDYNIYGIVKSGDNLGSARTVKDKTYFDFYKIKYL